MTAPPLNLGQSYRLRDMFLRMEWFRALPTARFPDERLAHSPSGIPYYYAGNLGTIVSIARDLAPIDPTIRGSKRRAECLRRAWEDYASQGKPVPKTYRCLPGLHYLRREPHYRTRHERVRLTFADGRSVRRGAHVLVLVAWVGAPGTGNVEADFFIDGCHLDGNPRNNRLRNLTWGDRQMNAQQREAHRHERLTRSAAQGALTFGGSLDTIDNLVDLDAERERRGGQHYAEAAEPDDLADIPF